MARNKHLSYNDIPDFGTDWMHDPTNGGKQFAGESVQKFIKDRLKESYGYSRTASGYMQFFRSPEDADAYDQGDTTKLLSQVSLQGTNVEFRFINQYAGNVFINGNNAYLFPITVRSVDVNSDGSETAHDANISLSISVNLNNGTTTTDLGTFPANEEFTVNITPYVADGATFVFTASDEDGNRRTSNRYTVIRANLSLQQQNNAWWATAYRQGDTQWNVPLAIDVNVPAELTATIRKNNVNYVSKTVPSSQFSANYALQLDHPLANGGTSGVYELHLELRATDESLASLPVESLDVNIFCVAADSTDLLLLTNNVATELQNYTNNRVMDYAVFAGSGNHTLTIEAEEDGTAITAPQTVTAQNGSVGTYYLNMEMERVDNADFTVTLTAHFDSSATDVLDIDITATNKLGYAATAGATLLVKANGRSNTESNREQLTNLLNGNVINPTWQNMTWSSVDGYLTRTLKDSAGQNVEVAFVRLLAGQTMRLPIQPLKMNANQGRTLELLFQPRNIMNYDTPVIQCLDAEAIDNSDSDSSEAIDPVAEGLFNGLRITPSRVTLLTAGSRNEDTQSKNFDPEDIIHLAIVVNPAYTEAGTSFSACFIYINGVKQRVFAYNKDLNVNANLLFGCADADLDIYAVRTYNAALTNDEIVTNAVNWRFSLADKAAMKAKNNIKENGKVDINKVRSLCNVFVFKAADGSGSIPTLGMAKGDKIHGTLKTYWRDNPSWNIEVECDEEGQGTSSMEYFRWNWKTSFSTAVNFDGGTHAAIKKLCGKKNYASSMQSHKMGGCEEYDYLARACGAVPSDAARQAIWQYPFVGFAEKVVNGQSVFEFIGLYTVGPDKGDKGTFGFGSNSVAMEGLDNDRLSTNFRVPWNDSTVTADSANEKYTVCGEKAWEDSCKNASGVASRWKPAYNFVYECSQLIRPWKGMTVGSTTYPNTLQGLQAYAAAIGAIDTSTDEGKEQYKDAVMYEYWISGSYDLYRYDQHSGEYVQAYTTAAINLSSALCGKGYVVGQQQSGGVTTDILLTTTLLSNAADDDARNELFKKARISKFKKEAGNYFNVTNAFFHLAWVEYKAATDNLAKNTYPYMLDATDADGRWCWRQDDVDTVGPIENQGKDKKPYCVELEDNYSDYGMASLWVWNGRYSQFWFTLKEAFATEYATFVRTVFFPALHYGSATNVMQRIMDFFQHFEFDRAQEYFGAALYNADGTYCYEQAHVYSGTYAHKGIALEQLLGDHYSAEKYWIRMRTVYMMSKYCADLFAAGQTVDCFATRVGEGVNTYTLTPAIYMYPVVQNGEQALQGPRFWPGNPALTEWTAGPITTAGDQTFRINGMSYIRSVGNLYQNTLKESVSVAGQMLRTLNIGSHTADPQDIKSTVTAIAIDNATSLRQLDLAQLETLQGSVNLSACANLRELYAQDTALASIVLADGGPLETLVLGDNITTLQLLGKQMLTTLTIGSTSRMTSVEMQNCNAYTTSAVMALLANISTSQLTSIKLGFGTQTSPSTLTDTDIATLLALGGSAAETKQFSGYITKASGSISGSTYVALEALNVTYIGNVTPEVTITSQDVTIAEGECTVYSGDSATFQAAVAPVSAGTPRFRLYNGSTAITEDANGIATYGGASLNCATGQFTTTAVSTAFEVKVSAFVGSGNDEVESAKVTVTVDKTIFLGGITISGTKSYTTTGDNTLVLTPTNNDFTVGIASIDFALEYPADSSSSDSSSDSSDAGGESAADDPYLAVTLTSLADRQMKAAVLAIPVATQEYALTVRVTDVKGNVYVDTATLAVQSIPVTSFAISGDAEVSAAGSYAYAIGSILPANYNRGIASLVVSVSAPTTGSISAAANGTTGATLTVTAMPDATEDVTLTVIATLTGGGNVTATKTVSLKVSSGGGGNDTVDLGLPSGLLWAKGNIVPDGNNYKVGDETDYGAYVSWGNVTPHFSTNGSTFDDSYDFGSSNSGPYAQTPGASIQFTSQHKNADFSASGGYDAARELLGGNWRMPTATEFQELYDNTDNEWATIDGVAGRKFMKKTDHSVYVFFPAAGNGRGSSLSSRGTYGDYWSSSLNSAGGGYNLNFYSSIVYPQLNSYRCRGFSVRAVQ